MGYLRQRFLISYVNDLYGNGIVKKVEFRSKEVFGWSSSMTLTLKDGKIIRKKHTEDSFYQAFLNSLSVRKSCSHCVFSKIPRQGDLTIGDFWGISKYDKSLNDRIGTSVVLSNNSKGDFMLKDMNSNIILNKKIPINYAITPNRAIEQPFKAHSGRKRFFAGIGKIKFNKLVDDCLSYHYDFGIVGLWYGLNYGSILTYFALNKVITDMGYQCLMINKPNELWTDKYTDRNTIANKFIYKNCYVANVNVSKEDQFRLNKHCDGFIVGSDVVWNYDICGKEAGHYFYLDFVAPGKKKIAYASSFGNYAHGPKAYEELTRYYLNQFNAISVREKPAVGYLKNIYNVNAEQVLDPVFLCDTAYYIKALNASRIKEKDEFITSYFLGPGPNKRRAVAILKGLFKIDYKNLYNPNIPVDVLEQRFGMELLRDVDVEDWLYYIYNCKIYIGDSFHGLCFAIIFHKPFIVMIDKNLSSRGRFDTLLNLVGLSDRLVYLDVSDDKIKELALSTIDYEKVDRLLQPLKTKSFNWLKNAVSLATNNVDYSKYEVKEIINYTMLNRIAYQDTKVERLYELVKNLYKERNFIPFTRNIDEYLAVAKENVSHSIYIISVKDTPGLSITEEMAVKLQQTFGIKQNMFQKHWKSYAAVVDEGKVIFEAISDARIDKVLNVGGYDLQITSAALNVGNTAKIIVNGIDYAINKRGFNIVAIDKSDGMVCDSVYIDMHLKQYAFGHRDVM